ncbi:hypothetical protein MHU86_1359 [Fragilaria crotonensis]|nr:hypothetical protein MHU86_1359 [Fragilaria crotonensis]
MDDHAPSHIHGKNDLAKENSGFQFVFEDHQNDAIPSHLLPPKHPIHVKGPPKLTVAAIRTTSSSNHVEEVGVNDDEEKCRDIELQRKDGKEVQQPEECNPLDVPQADIAGSISNVPIKKWYFQPGYLAMFAGATCIVIVAIVVPVILSSNSQAAPTTAAPTSSSTSAPTFDPTLSPEQIACNFIGRPNLVDCRSTVEVATSSSNAAGVTIPSEIGVLTQLTHLEYDLSELIGTIPSTISNLSRLNFLSLFDNKLTGTIPPLATLSQLTYLNLGHNELIGSIPSLSNLSKLDYLSVGSNQLTGTIPALSNLSLLTWLELEGNEMIGTIPSLSNLSQLTSLLLYDTQLTGTMPSYLCSLQGISIYIDCGEITCDPTCCNCW